MKKYILITSLVGINIFGQVGINTSIPDPSSALDINSTNKGFLPSKVALISTTNPNPVGTNSNKPIDGLLVYNTETKNDVTPNYYVWQTNKWQLIGGETINNILYDDYINVDWLGYQPLGSGDTSDGNISTNGVTATKLGCKKWTKGNNHSYCAYKLNNGVDWKSAFEIAKQLKGYLTTITTYEEWNWVKTNIIDKGTGYDLYNSIWMGFNKVKNPGNPYRIEWITGEVSKVNQGNVAVIQNNFAPNQPDNGGGTEGCGHVFSTLYSDNNNNTGDNPTKRYWNDYVCSERSNTAGGNSNSGPANGTFDQIIVEFQN